MTAVEWRDNVAVVGSPRWPAAETHTPPAIGPLPARLSPRPLRVLAARIGRSQFAADLRDYGWLIGLLLAALLVLVMRDQLAAVIPGGTL